MYTPHEQAFKILSSARDKFVKRIQRCEEMKASWKTKYEERFPMDVYGLKGSDVWEDKRREYDAEIKELRAYLTIFNDIVDEVEKRMKNGTD